MRIAPGRASPRYIAGHSRTRGGRTASPRLGGTVLGPRPAHGEPAVGCVRNAGACSCESFVWISIATGADVVDLGRSAKLRNAHPRLRRAFVEDLLPLVPGPGARRQLSLAFSTDWSSDRPASPDDDQSARRAGRCESASTRGYDAPDGEPGRDPRRSPEAADQCRATRRRWRMPRRRRRPVAPPRGRVESPTPTGCEPARASAGGIRDISWST